MTKKKPYAWTVSASVTTNMWNWIETERNGTPRRAFVRKALEFYREHKEK